MKASRIASAMLGYNRPRLVASIVGVGVAFFLVQAQFGLLVGWIHTCTALVRHADVDLWVMARQTPAFDYGTAIPRQRIYQARSVPGVAWTEGMFVAWNVWQRGDGRHVNVQLVGLDRSGVGGPWEMAAGVVNAVHRPQTVIVDHLYRKALGVVGIGEDFELVGQRARVGGLSRGVRTLSACPFVFTSLAQAIRYDRRYRDDQITYVIVRCKPGADVGAVQREMSGRIPGAEVLTTAEFVGRSARYWMLETGIGITVIVTAVLGLAVGTVILSQTLFAITQDNLAHYSMLLAVGFSGRTLVMMILGQALVLGVSGMLLGIALLLPAAWLSAQTPIPLETTPGIFMTLCGVSLLTCLAASIFSVRRLGMVDPVSVFHG